MSDTLELPQNKPSINGKYPTQDAIKSAIDKVLKKENVEGQYSDENWAGVQKIQFALGDNGIPYELLDASYVDYGEAPNSNLPTKKVYRFELKVRDRNGKNMPIFLKVICSFIGKTGTMADSEYELNYYFF